MKTLAVILHHNTPQYTDVLYEMLAPEQESGQYDLVVIDNGSDPGKESKYNTYRLDENVYFGGGMNAAMNLVLEDDNYDSLLFLNSDLIVGKKFVWTLRQRMLMDALEVSSPCIIQPEKTQNHWQQMLNWGWVKPRSVRWIDLQCPLITKNFIKNLDEIKKNDNLIDPLLIRGWGIDIWFGILAEKWESKTGVVDCVPAVHLGSATLKALGNTNEYCRLAEEGQFEFFNKNEFMPQVIDMRKWAENYKA